MKIVSWNCNKNFQEKFSEISKLDADLFIIQDCENPNQTDSEEYKEFSSNHIWIGDSIGLGIFAKGNITLKPIPYYGDSKYFLSVNVDNSFNLLAVWTCPNEFSLMNYTQELLDCYNDNESLFDGNLIMCGDFNADMSLGGPHAQNFSDFISTLRRYGLEDIYHRINDEREGDESQATFYLYKDLNKPLHLDHVFAESYIVTSFKILDKEWLKYSDHLPLVFEIEVWPKIDSDMKICPKCYQLYIEKDECPKCGIELETLDKFANDTDKFLEHRRGLHIL